MISDNPAQQSGSSVAAKEGRLLLIEPSSTMRYVLETYLKGLGYSSLALDNFAAAQSVLRAQYENFKPGGEIECVLFGWQSARDTEASKFLAMLESPDFHDLSAIVLSQELRSDSRAWVGGRNKTTLLRWKDYREVDDRLQSLLDSSLDIDDTQKTVKFSNHDIQILVVDDSASIRFALRDLLELHGYRVTVVSTHDEAINAARSSQFDIAVLDYYLEDSTGDAVCEDLIKDPQVGDITCAILTGSYSDHIIKSCLRSGAVECMFKNESSELLLARIDAISRIVRSRKALLANQSRLDRVTDELGGPVLLLDKGNHIVFMNRGARRLLGYDLDTASERVIGKPARTVLNDDLCEQLDALTHAVINFEGSLNDASGATREIEGQAKRLDIMSNCSGGEATLVVFRHASEQAGLISAPATVAADSPEFRDEDDPDNAKRFIERVNRHLKRQPGSSSAESDTSVLLIEMAHVDSNSSLKPAISDPVKLDELANNLRKIYPDEGDLAYFGSSRFAFLIHHSDAAHALMQARRVMQACNRLGDEAGMVKTSCVGALLHLRNRAHLTSADVLAKLHRKMPEVAHRGRNTALLLDHDRYMSVYPDHLKSV